MNTRTYREMVGSSVLKSVNLLNTLSVGLLRTTLVAFAVAASVSSFASDCHEAFDSSKSAIRDAANQKLLLDYQRIAEATGLLPHKVSIVDGKGHLKIGFLMARDREFSKTSLEVVRKGLLSEIDAGEIVGPKVLPLLALVARVNPPSNLLIISGRLHPGGIFHEVYVENHGEPTEKAESGATIVNYRYFSEKELRDFESAVDFFKIKSACQEIFGVPINKCRELTFVIDTFDPNLIKWTRAPIEK